ncbi:MAG: elongator complex protein 4 [Oscillospiraceae bacterium]|nr:elongator complex protein 4 [Oscillospiraceae bacterium]
MSETPLNIIVDEKTKDRFNQIAESSGFSNKDDFINRILDLYQIESEKDSSVVIRTESEMNNLADGVMEVGDKAVIYNEKSSTKQKASELSQDTDKSKIYERTFKKEILIEFASSIHASFCHYMDRNNIDFMDTTNIIAMLASDAAQSKNDILDCPNIEGLSPIDNYLQYLQSVILRLREIEKNEQ